MPRTDCNPASRRVPRPIRDNGICAVPSHPGLLTRQAFGSRSDFSRGGGGAPLSDGRRPLRARIQGPSSA
jgi:hypothetical protein